MGKASKGKPSSPGSSESLLMEEALKALRSQGSAQASMVERMEAMEETTKLRMEAMEARNATLFDKFEGLLGPLLMQLAEVERRLDLEEARVEKYAFEKVEGNMEEVTRRIEAVELRLEEVSSTTVSSEAPSTSSTEEAHAKGVRGGRSTHQPKTPTECWGCGKGGHKRFQ